MFEGLRTVIYPVADINRAKEWYATLLGQQPYFDQPFYVGFTVGGFELGLLPSTEHTPAGQSGPITYWGVQDAAAALARLRELGASEGSPVQDVGDGILVATAIDPFGNTIGVIVNPHFSRDNVR